MERAFVMEKLAMRTMMCTSPKDGVKPNIAMKSKRTKKVLFDTKTKTITNPKYHTERSEEDLKAAWYSHEELMQSCREAKKIVGMIGSVNGDMDAIDHNRVCVVGLEKFHGKKERDNYRKLLIKSVLIRQEMNRGLGLDHDPDGYREISQMISASFKEIALWQATMHKFHAYGTPSTRSQQKTCRRNQSIGFSKRQKLNSEVHKNTASTTSKPLVEDTAEIRQIMAQYCSR